MLTLTAIRRNPWFVLLGACSAGMLASSCGPNEKLVMRDRVFSPASVHKIDLLPVDFYVHLDDVDKTGEKERKRVNQQLSASIEEWARRFLGRQGYAATNRITWDGASGEHGFVGGQDIRELVDDILDFVNDESIPEGAGDFDLHVAPDKLKLLAAATGADAVLYINGKASVETDAKKTQKAVTAICCFVITAVFLALLYNSSKGSSGRGGRGHAGPAPRAGGHGPAVAHSGPGPGPRPHGYRPAPGYHPHAYGPDVEIGFYTPIFIHPEPDRPYGGYAAEEQQEQDEGLGGDRLWLSFTLVDSGDGRVLWFARQVIDVSATDDAALAQTMQELLAGFPRAGGAAHHPLPGGKVLKLAAPPDASAPAAAPGAEDGAPATPAAPSPPPAPAPAPPPAG